MPELDGVEAMRRIAAEDPQVRFIVLTTFDSDEYIFDAIEAGAKGYLLKDASRDELFQAVRAVHRGESLIQPGVAARVLDRFAQLSRQASSASGVDVLSGRDSRGAAADGWGRRQQGDRSFPVYQRKHGENSRGKHTPKAGCEGPDSGSDSGHAKGDHKTVTGPCPFPSLHNTPFSRTNASRQ